MDFSWANKSIDEVSALIAERAQKKAAELPGDLKGMGDAIKTNVDKLTGMPALTNTLSSAARTGLAGAGIGALAGGLSSLTAPKKKRRFWSDIGTGALIGGAGGAGLGLALPAMSPGSNAAEDIEKLRAQRLVADRAERYGGNFISNAFNAPVNAGEALWSGGKGGLVEALKTIDPGVKNLFDYSKGLPLPNPNMFADKNQPWTIQAFRDGLPGLGGKMPFHANVLALQGGLDALLTGLRKSWRWGRDPEAFRHGLSSPEAANENITKETLDEMNKKFQGKPDSVVRRFLYGYDPDTGQKLPPGVGYQVKQTVKPEEYRSLLNINPTKDQISQHIKPDFRTFGQNVDKLYADFLKNIQTRLDPTEVASLINNNQIIDPGSLKTPAAIKNYINAIGKINPQINQIANNAVRLGMDNTELAKNLYDVIKHHQGLGPFPLQAIENLKRVAGDQAAFDRLVSLGGGKDVLGLPPVGKYELPFVPKNMPRGGKVSPQILFKADQFKMPVEDALAFGRNPITDAQRLRINIQNYNGPNAEALKAIANQLPDSELLAKVQAGENLSRVVGTLDPSRNRHIWDVGYKNLAAANADKGFLRRPVGGIGSRATAGQPSIVPQNPPVIYPGQGSSLNSWLKAGPQPGWRLGHQLARLPRWQYYGAPLFAQEVFSRIFGGNGPPDERAILDTPEAKPYIDQEFANKAQDLVRLLGNEAQGLPQQTSLQERLKIINILNDPSLNDYQRGVQVKNLLGYGGGYRPYQP